MIDREALFAHRTRWENTAFRLVVATLDEERDAVETYGRVGFDTARWRATLLTVWRGSAVEWSAAVDQMIPVKTVVEDEPGLLARLSQIVTGKATGIVEVSEEEWLEIGEGIWTPERAKTIADSEVVQSTAWSQHETAATKPLELFKVWVAIIDDRTRQSHLDAHGQRQALNDPYEVGGASLQYPADAGGPLSEIINCRCYEDYELA